MENTVAAHAKSALLDYKAKLDTSLEKYFRVEKRKAKKISPYALKTIEYLRQYTTRGGKRLRGAFVYYAYLMMGGQSKREILKTSMFIELIQTYLLIEDDIMDSSPTRRGAPTMHMMWEEFHHEKFSKRDPAHFGMSIALTAGLIASHMALKLLADARFKKEYVVDACSHVNDMIRDVGHGQIHDILLEVRDDVKEKDVVMVDNYKTAKYTYELPILTGAILAGATPRDIKRLSVYAYHGGVAFQLQDDLLGMFGDEEKLGKPADSDLKEGKQTILILQALKKANKLQTTRLLKALGNPNVSKKEVEAVRGIIKDTGSYAYSVNLARKFVQKAQKALMSFKRENEGKSFMHGIAQYMIEREF